MWMDENGFMHETKETPFGGVDLGLQAYRDAYVAERMGYMDTEPRKDVGIGLHRLGDLHPPERAEGYNRGWVVKEDLSAGRGFIEHRFRTELSARYFYGTGIAIQGVT